MIELTEVIPLISIITPCYNSEKYVAEALDSVINQTYKNWECIIVDDNSSDGTWNLLEDYQRKYPDKIFLYKNDRKGASAARNIGIEKSKGEYLKFLDSDDLLFDNNIILTQIMSILNKENTVIYGNEFFFNNDLGKNSIEKTRGNPIFRNKPKTLFENFPITSNFLIKKNELGKLRWNEILKSGQEFYLIFQLFIRNIEFYYQDINSCKIRVHSSPDRISNKSGYLYIEQTLTLYKEIIAELQRFEIIDNDLIISLKRKLLVESFNALRVKNKNAFNEFQKIDKSSPFNEYRFNSTTYTFISTLNSLDTEAGFFAYRFFSRLKMI